MLKKHWKPFSLIVMVFAGLALSIGAVALKKTAEQEKEVSIDQVPDAVKATILAQGGTIKEIEMETKNGQTVYEADVIIDGQKIEVKVAADGTLLGKKVDDDDDEDEDEQEVSLNEVPEVVKATILKEADGAEIGEVVKETEDGQIVYEAEFVINGQEVEIEVAADGTLLEKEIENDDDD